MENLFLEPFLIDINIRMTVQNVVTISGLDDKLNFWVYISLNYLY